MSAVSGPRPDAVCRCLWCGKDPEVESDGRMYRAVCPGRSVSTGWLPNRMDAVDAWNAMMADLVCLWASLGRSARLESVDERDREALSALVDIWDSEAVDDTVGPDDGKEGGR